jgi:hypothetical protein
VLRSPKLVVWHLFGSTCGEMARIFAIQRIVALLAVVVAIFLPSSAAAQPEGQAAAERLKQEKQGANKYRGAAQVPNRNAVIQNMEQLFEPVLIKSKDDGSKDEWYEAHLRDAWFDDVNRNLEAVKVRGQTRPFDNIGDWCLWWEVIGFVPPPDFTACPIGACGYDHVWHGEPFSNHRPLEACWGPATTPYRQLITDTNFKVCCVRKEEQGLTSEQIASAHPEGSGWAGLFEYYYPTAALGWENDRTTTMIVDKGKVDKCIQQADLIMESEAAQKWVAKAIERNLTTVSNGAGVGNAAAIEAQIAQDIRDLRPEDRDLRFADSLQSEGLTLRVNLAAMQTKTRHAFSERICGRPEQLDKLMDPTEDLLQKEGSGGPTVEALDANIPVWASYCPEGVTLMTDPEKSLGCRNPDLPVKTDLQKGTLIWQTDPLYCQAMNVQNPNITKMGFDRAIMEHAKGQYTKEQVGYTCLVPEANLNAGMAPVTLVRQAAIERRTAITDHAIGFMIAGAIAPGMITGQRSYYKRFEPQAYSMEAPFKYQTFIGKPVKGGGTNELGQDCPGYNGKGLFMRNKSDRLYISKATHEPFTQQIIDESNDINKYVQDWSDQQKEKIANRGLDEKSQNYAAAFRIFATCPKGYVRWEPPEDEHNLWLRENIRLYCREENFGGIDKK